MSAANSVMHSQHIGRLFVAVVIFLLLLCVPAQTVLAQARAAGPAAVVQDFYRFHFGHGMGFDEQGVRRRQRWLTAELYKLLLAELRKPVAPDEVPYFDGDPFTDSQEYPTTFRVGRAAVTGARARVPVTLLWVERGRVVERRIMRVELRRARAGWRLANFTPPDNKDLLSELRRKE